MQRWYKTAASVVLSWIKVRLVLKCMKMSQKRRYECLEHVLVTHSTFHYQMVAQCKLNWLVCLELEFQSNMVLDIRFCPEEFCSSAFILDCVRMICTQCIDWMLPALLIHFHDIRQPLELSHQQFHARNDSCLIHALFSLHKYSFSFCSWKRNQMLWWNWVFEYNTRMVPFNSSSF